MDLIEELKNIRKNGNFDILMDLRDEMHEMRKKLYTLEIIEIASHAQKLYEEGAFLSNNIHSIEVKKEYKDNNYFDCKFKNSSNKYTKYLNVKNSKDLKSLIQSFKQLDDFTFFTNESLVFNTWNYIKTDKNIRENILNLFLSKELKKVVDYSELEVNINENQQVKKPKAKI